VDASGVEERHAAVFLVTQEQREFGAAKDDCLNAFARFDRVGKLEESGASLRSENVFEQFASVTGRFDDTD
jgi:hypothetical protein